METLVIVVAVASILTSITVFILVIIQSYQKQNTDFEAVVNKVFGMSAGKVAEQSKLILQGERAAIKENLDGKQKSIEELVKALRDDIKSRQDELKKHELERTESFALLSKTLEEQRKVTDKLSETTGDLSKVLSNNQQRGAWGERIIEDLLLANGLVEGVHFAKQQVLSGQSTLRPDISLLLPNDRVVAVDVKFPFSQMQQFASSQSKSEQQTHLKQFHTDVKKKIDKVAEYIDPESRTLDYAILFVPNETVFSFINQHLPDLADYAISQRVLFVSPFTFLIVARTVMESYRNFMIGDTLKDVIMTIDDFAGEWEKYKTSFEKYGKSIDSLKKSYEELSGTRTRQLDRKLQKVQEYQSGVLEEGKHDQATLK
ncbi:DNA recombination protein RmuC [Candidatus Woesebacteria bacterium]|nr:DNA recombination protein RmuC [Candidatus Woesebacteria bacterium]